MVSLHDSSGDDRDDLFGAARTSSGANEGLLMDLQVGRLVSPACNAKCLVTFHYYEPRMFTQARRRTPQRPAPCSPSESADVRARVHTCVRAYELP